MILSRNSVAHLKTGMASPTTALVAPRASIGGRDERVDWESCWGVQFTDSEQFKLWWERVSSGIKEVSSQTLDGDSVDSRLCTLTEILTGSKYIPGCVVRSRRQLESHALRDPHSWNVSTPISFT